MENKKQIWRDAGSLNNLSPVQGERRFSLSDADWPPCPPTMAAAAGAQRRSGSMRPGGLGSTQLIQKLAQLAWYWWPPYRSLKLSVSELNACRRERVKYYTPGPSVHSGDRGIDKAEKRSDHFTTIMAILLPSNTFFLSTSTYYLLLHL